MDTGARLGEAVRLQWEDVELRQEGRGVVRFLITKTRKPRSVPLTRRAEALLQRLLANRPGDHTRVFLIRTTGCKWRGTTPQAKPFRNPHGAWKTCANAAGLDDFRLHDLRHTYASRLVQRDVPLLTVSRLLGHASLKMTMRYAHLATANLDAAVAKLD
jgi:integrase